VLRLMGLILLFLASLATNISYAQQYKKEQNSTPLRIAVAANFTPVLKILLKDFTEKTGIKSQVISGGSGTLFLQIKHGAPFDIFLSADSRRPKALVKAGLALNNSCKTYAIGQLAFYSSLLSTKQLTLDRLKTPPVRFAIANPDIAPYGKAAKETLTDLGLWQRYQPHLITGLNINQTFTQLRSKAVTSGLVANSQLVLNNLSGVIIPSNYHQPINQQLVIIRASKKQDEAKRLSQFLRSIDSQKIITSYGYVPFIIENKIKNNPLKNKVLKKVTN